MELVEDRTEFRKGTASAVALGAAAGLRESTSGGHGSKPPAISRQDEVSRQVSAAGSIELDVN